MSAGLNSELDRLNSNLNFNFNSPMYANFSSDLFDDLDIECRYYSEESFVDLLGTLPKNYLAMCSLNCQSLKSKYVDINNFLTHLEMNNSNLHFFGIQEVWQAHLINPNLTNFKGYNLFTKTRVDSRGGGVGFLIKDHFHCEVLFEEFFIENIFESIVLKVKYLDNEFILANIYRPPNNSNFALNSFFESFDNLLDQIHQDHNDSCLFLFGDFNINLLSAAADPSGPAAKFLETLAFNGILNLVSRATRITTDTFSLIDIIGTNCFFSDLAGVGVIATDISDHYMPFSVYSMVNVKPPSKPNYFNKRIINDDNLVNFKNSLLEYEWENVHNSTNPSEAYSFFIKKFLDLYNFHLPVRKIKFNSRTMPKLPYISNEILNCRLFKQRLSRIAKSSSSQLNVNIYNRYRNEYNRVVKRSKKLFYRTKLRKAAVNKDSKSLWNSLKDLLGLHKTKSNVEFLEVDGERVEGDLNLCNAFNAHFSKVGENLQGEIPKTNRQYYEFLPPRNENNLFFAPLDPVKVFNLIRSIRPKKSCDDNDVSMHIISYCAEALAAPLTTIFNLSLSQGSFPDLMGISRTIAIHKGGLKSLLDMYRGISLINNFSKVLEKHVYNCLLEFLDEHRFWSPNQFGFRKGYSTIHACLNLSNIVHDFLASGKVVMAIFLDVKKCFDMIPRDILLSKLYHYGIRGIPHDWFCSYFSNRKQRFFFNGIESSTLEDIIVGVLQGSILGVILFLIFINDLNNCCPDIINNLFADDCLSIIFGDDLNDLVSKAQRAIPTLVDWYACNRLIIHPGKTKAIVFSSPRPNYSEEDSLLLEEFPVFINLNDPGVNDPSKISRIKIIPNNDESWARLLGILIDDKLSYKYHLANVQSKVNRVIFSLQQMKHILDQRHLKILYSAYIRSVIEYGSILFTRCTATLLKPLKTLQKKAVRIVSNSGYREHTTPLFKQLKILPINELIKFNCCKFMFDYKCNKTPEIFNNTWQYNYDVHNHVTRNANNFAILHAQHNYIRDSPKYMFPRLFNSLPREIRVIENRREFLRKLENYLLQNLE